ncbi:nitronate monooxygenase [Candidatus Sumerlaeota bacterium]|nr:nitronate monooxygenase [Candidatus Sumerlaeota bacterium]
MLKAGGFPQIIQGGMGVAVSGWRLANAVARRGQLGVVSGTGLDQVLARRLQLGDSDGALRRAIAAFPCRATAEAALSRYFIPGGKDPCKGFLTPPMFNVNPSRAHLRFAALSAFVEVWLAKEGHAGPVGINLLEKIALPNPAMICGAMIAGVDFVLMGAGIPWQIPGLLDAVSRNESFDFTVTVEGDPAGVDVHFDVAALFPDLSPLKRPAFLAIVSSATLAQALLKRANGRIDGFVVESPVAGGHNAPPRGAVRLNERGEPIYGERDQVDPTRMVALGLPFWLAGGEGTHISLARARSLGAHGVQVGTAFAFCQESGLDPVLRANVLGRVAEGRVDVFTDPEASPTGFPFKVVRYEGTLSEEDIYAGRERVCDAGYLRRVFRYPDGRIGYRCPGEPEADYVAKGGDIEDTQGCKCLCNALLADIGLGQIRDGVAELPLLTAGDALKELPALVGEALLRYTASDVIDALFRESIAASEDAI